MSDEEAQEVTRLLSPIEVKDHWQPNASSSFLQDSDSAGPQSLNDSLAPSSLQEDSRTESVGGSFTEITPLTQTKEPTSVSQMKESVSSIDISSYDDGLTSSKMESSVSDSGLIGEF